MWQRIQTLYLALVVVLMTAAILLPSATLFVPEESVFYRIDSRGIVQLSAQGSAEKVAATNPCTFIFGLILFLATFSVFSFKNRRKQMRLATGSLFGILIYIVALAVFIFMGQSKLNAQLTLNFPVVLPVVALIFNYLAMRGIARDEKLVRSLDRLR